MVAVIRMKIGALQDPCGPQGAGWVEGSGTNRWPGNVFVWFEPCDRRHNFRSRVWKPAVTKAGLAGVKIRHLRHTGASMVLAAVGSLKDVSERLGHTSTRMADELYTEL
jgi:integrase